MVDDGVQKRMAVKRTAARRYGFTLSTVYSKALSGSRSNTL